MSDPTWDNYVAYRAAEYDPLRAKLEARDRAWFPMSMGGRHGEPERKGLPWLAWFTRMLYQHGMCPPADARLAMEIADQEAEAKPPKDREGDEVLPWQWKSSKTARQCVNTALELEDAPALDDDQLDAVAALLDGPKTDDREGDGVLRGWIAYHQGDDLAASTPDTDLTAVVAELCRRALEGGES